MSNFWFLFRYLVTFCFWLLICLVKLINKVEVLLFQSVNLFVEGFDCLRWFLILNLNGLPVYLVRLCLLLKFFNFVHGISKLLSNGYDYWILFFELVLIVNQHFVSVSNQFEPGMQLIDLCLLPRQIRLLILHVFFQLVYLLKQSAVLL